MIAVDTNIVVRYWVGWVRRETIFSQNSDLKSRRNPPAPSVFP
ncbi:hypothetical protein AmaxDRAFT_3697 [Limnospira maxima CS-328]|uniref:Uncharacterized protein n=1 Tax=Limnospira maxima CS-328 TaxID=513049 RepID=B5W4J9_LIMMA|nr:hypothetical protein AmaxDRAFT_3697 [Limnospira maxima CS-328]